MDFIFLDESGDLGFGPGSSGFFTVACLLSCDQRAVKRMVRRVKKRLRIPRKVELKIPSTKLSLPAYLRARASVFAGLADNGCVAHAITVKKGNIATRLRNAHESILYNYAAGLLLTDVLCGLPEGAEAEIVLDRRTISAKHGFKIDDYLKLKLWAERERADISLTVRHEESSINGALQAAHLTANTVFRKYARGDEAGTRLLAPILRNDRKLLFGSLHK